MKYLCLVYFEPRVLEGLSPGERATLTRESLAYDEELGRNGQYIAAEALEPVRTATTVRVRKGTMVATDGPFAETKEVVGGFILVDAMDRNEAVRIAAGIPLARLGSIEVRPVMQMDGG